MTRNWYLERDREREERERERERERESKKQGRDIDFSSFLIIIFFLIFSVNIQPFSKRKEWKKRKRMEYFNVKIRLLIRGTQSE